MMLECHFNLGVVHATSPKSTQRFGEGMTEEIDFQAQCECYEEDYLQIGFKQKWKWTHGDCVDVRFVARKGLFAHSISNIPHLAAPHHSSISKTGPFSPNSSKLSESARFNIPPNKLEIILGKAQPTVVKALITSAGKTLLDTAVSQTIPTNLYNPVRIFR